MKKRVGLFLLAGFVLPFLGCSKSDKSVTADMAGKALATVLCDKHAGCQQPGTPFNKDQCLQEISTGLAGRLKGKTNLVIKQAMLDACSKTIATGDCALLVSEAPPSGCEFLE